MNSMILFLLVACITLTLWRGTDGDNKIMKPANGVYNGKKVVGIIVDGKKGKCGKCKKNGCCGAKQTRKCGGNPSGCKVCNKIKEGFQELNAKLEKVVDEWEKNDKKNDIVTAWQNELHEKHYVKCEDSSIAEVKSVHSNSYQDRQWECRCRTVPNGASLGTCKWHKDVNQVQEAVAFRCPTTQVITGASSLNEEEAEDRRFSFRCCHLQDKRLDRCSLTGLINEYDGLMDYRAPYGYVIVGFQSEYNNKHNDRLWKVEICHVS